MWTGGKWFLLCFQDEFIEELQFLSLMFSELSEPEGGRKRSSVWFEWHFKSNTNICSVTSVHFPWAFPADSVVCEKLTCAASSLYTRSKRRDLLRILSETCSAAGPVGPMLYKTLHRHSLKFYTGRAHRRCLFVCLSAVTHKRYMYLSLFISFSKSWQKE